MVASVQNLPVLTVTSLVVDVADLSLNQLFIYKGCLYYLMETPGSVMNAMGIDELILENLKLPAMRIACRVQQTNGSYLWIGCSKPCVEQFWATAEVQPFTYDPTKQEGNIR